MASIQRLKEMGFQLGTGEAPSRRVSSLAQSDTVTTSPLVRDHYRVLRGASVRYIVVD